MDKFAHLPVEVEACQFKGGHETAAVILDWMDKFDAEATHNPAREENTWRLGACPEHVYIELPDVEDPMILWRGDWLVRSAEGTFTRYKSEMFDKNFKEIYV